MAAINKTYLFIDESGDPVFYGNRKKLLVGTDGFQPYLIIGMIETSDRRALRKAVVDFMADIKSDNLYNTIPSVANEKAGMFMPGAIIRRLEPSFLNYSVNWMVTKPILL